MVTALRSGQDHISVGGSAEEFISIHVLGCPRAFERLLVLSSDLPSNPLKILFFADWETIKSCWLSFQHPRRQNLFLTKA